MRRNIKNIATGFRFMALLKAIMLCLLVGLVMGFVGDLFLRDVINMSAYIITIPAAFAPFITGTLKIKKSE